MKLAELDSAFLMEDKQKHISWKHDQNFIVNIANIYFLLCGTKIACWL